MSDPTDSTPRSIALRGNRSLSAVGNSLISRGLQDLAELAATPSLMPTVQTDDIHEAARNGDHASVRQILKNDPAKIDARDSDRSAPLHLAAEYGHADVAEVLLSHGAEVNARDEWHRTPLHYAAEEPDVAELLLSHGADVNARDNYGEMPLHWAAKLGQTDVAEVLLAHGADVNARDNDGDTPLDHAPFDDTAETLRRHGGTSGKAVR